MNKAIYQQHQETRQSLIDAGWKTPNTYCNAFGAIEDAPAVYLFLLVERESFQNSLIAYVGMSKRLKSRLCGHPIRSAIECERHWIMTWFKPTPADALRETEARYIHRFDPPWNIAGRRRGVSLP